MEALGRRCRGSPAPAPRTTGLEEDNVYAFSSGYLARARHLMPKSSPALPWRHNMDYLADARDFRERPVDDGVLSFGKAKGALAQAAE